jgi:hypothetical protein
MYYFNLHGRRDVHSHTGFLHIQEVGNAIAREGGEKSESL